MLRKYIVTFHLWGTDPVVVGAVHIFAKTRDDARSIVHAMGNKFIADEVNEVN